MKASNTKDGVWRYVKRVPEGCWEWQAHCRKEYGCYYFPGRHASRAHRIAYESANEVSLTPDQHVLHTCDNPKCCRPSHLFLGDSTVNQADMRRKKRNASFVGQKNGQAKFTEDQVRDMKYSKESANTIALRYGTHPQHVRAIRRGVFWPHV